MSKTGVVRDGRVQAFEMRVRNFKRISLVYIDLTSGDIIEIRGDTAQGKTSVLDAIEAVASRFVSPSMVHRGAAKAEIMIQLDGARIERVIPAEEARGKRRNGTTLVTVDGHAIKDGEAYAEAIFGRGGFRPMDFVRLGMGDAAGRTDRLRQQRRMLLSALPELLTGTEINARVKMLGDDVYASMCEIDLDGLDLEGSAYGVCEEIEAACLKRFTEANGEYERAQRAMELTPAPDRVAPKADQETCEARVQTALEQMVGAKEREKGIAGRRSRMTALRAEIAKELDLPGRAKVGHTRDAYVEQCQVLTGEVDDIQSRIAALRKELIAKEGELNEAVKKREQALALERRVAAQETRLADLLVLERELASEGTDEDVQGLRAALEEARADSEARRLQDAHDANARLAASNAVKMERFKRLVALFRDEIPREILAKADLGVEGLTLDQDQLYVGDDPLIQLGNSAQMVVAVRIWAGMHPRAPLVPIDGAESLGADDRIALARAAKELGVTMILTYVDADAEPSPGVVVMRDGTVVN